MKSPTAKHSVLVRIAATIGVLFGLMTVREGGAVLFVDGAARLAAGNYVPFVLWFNFLAGFAYVVAGLGLWLRQTWAARLAIGIAISTLLVFAAFGWHVLDGGLHETRTVVAMTLRSSVWCLIAAVGWWTLLKTYPHAPGFRSGHRGAQS